jgi:hypothetical protein
MTGSIYLVHDNGSLVAMSEHAYDSEALLQELLAKYPDLLAGDQMNQSEPRRWLLVSREVPLAGETNGSNRWSVDHLFLDQDAVPTIVEVKRGRDTRIRREVVGQMLDYAANAVVYWPIEHLQTCFEQTCTDGENEAEVVLGDHLQGEMTVSDSWQRVQTNLQAGKVRLVFVADEIPPELQRVVEFLNTQMSPAEVLAVEIRQFVGEGLKTLVPRVLGQTQEAQQKKRPGSIGKLQWDEDSFFGALEAVTGAGAADIARRLMEWAVMRGLVIWFGQGKPDGSLVPILKWKGKNHFTFSVWTYGRIEIQFAYMQGRIPFGDLSRREDIRQRLNAVLPNPIPEDSLTRRPSITLLDLANKDRLAKFLAVFDWVLDEIKAT